MSGEDQFLDWKSLRTVTGRTADWKELAGDCVCFANGRGGSILIGIEDGALKPLGGQVIPRDLSGKIKKRIGELTVNVTVATEIKTASNGAEYIELRVSRSHSAASTTDGRYFIRISDNCKPLVGDDIQRLLEERNAQTWETLTSLQVPRERIDPEKLEALAQGMRESERVKPSVKEKSDFELLDHYILASGPWLTNLGVHCVGRPIDRVRPGNAPIIQFIKVEDLKRYPGSAIGDIHHRIGTGINRRRIKRAIDRLVNNGAVYYKGEKRGRRYWVSK